MTDQPRPVETHDDLVACDGFVESIEAAEAAYRAGNEGEARAHLRTADIHIRAHLRGEAV